MMTLPTDYCVAVNDAGQYLYVDMGWLESGTLPRKSGMCPSIEGVPKLLRRLEKARDKTIITQERELRERFVNYLEEGTDSWVRANQQVDERIDKYSKKFRINIMEVSHTLVSTV